MNSEWLPVAVVIGSVGLVTGVIALLTAVEVSKRISNIMETRLRAAEITLADNIAAHKSDIEEVSARVAILSAQVETDFASQDKTLAELRDVLSELQGLVDNRKAPPGQRRGLRNV